MELHVSRALWALAVVSACGCGLAKGGLFVGDDGGDDGATSDAALDDGATDDSTAADDGAMTNDGQGADAADDRESGGGTRDGRADAKLDGAKLDAGGDERLDAATDMIVDAPIDAFADGPADGADDATDAPSDSPPPTIVWDGGAIADPQFADGDWVAFCAALVACGHLPSMSTCAALQAQPGSADALIPPPDMVQAVEFAAPDCAAVDQALGDGTVCLSTSADSCSGDVMVTCRWGFAMRVDCGALGLVCSSGAGNAGCGFGDCSLAEEGQTFCVGPSYVARCVAGRYVPDLDCHTFGGTCVGPGGAAQCQGPPGTMCTSGTGCAGDSIVACMNGLLGGVGCSQAYGPSFTCLVNDAGAPVCAAGTSCNPATFQDTCGPAGALTFCNAGVAADYDCVGSGWADCSAAQCIP